MIRFGGENERVSDPLSSFDTQSLCVSHEDAARLKGLHGEQPVR